MRAMKAGIVLLPRSFFPNLYNHEVKFLKLSFIFDHFRQESDTICCVLLEINVKYNTA